jgi:hypothetical protein
MLVGECVRHKALHFGSCSLSFKGTSAVGGWNGDRKNHDLSAVQYLVQQKTPRSKLPSKYRDCRFLGRPASCSR